jgi:hypothetical protein
MLLDMRIGYTIFCCFICGWDKCEISNQWAVGEYLRHEKSLCGQKNIASNRFAYSQKTFLLPLPIKLGLKEKSVNAMEWNGEGFWSLTQNFPYVNDKEINRMDLPLSSHEGRYKFWSSRRNLGDRL